MFMPDSGRSRCRAADSGRDSVESKFFFLNQSSRSFEAMVARFGLGTARAAHGVKTNCPSRSGADAAADVEDPKAYVSTGGLVLGAFSGVQEIPAWHVLARGLPLLLFSSAIAQSKTPVHEKKNITVQ
jgi:hypothetical protein